MSAGEPIGLRQSGSGISLVYPHPNSKARCNCGEVQIPELTGPDEVFIASFKGVKITAYHYRLANCVETHDDIGPVTRRRNVMLARPPLTH